MNILKKIKDPRIRFLNLAERGNYPENKRHRHMVAGSVPCNKAPLRQGATSQWEWAEDREEF
ncbi:MAG: hypothetical protein KAW12_31265 [Candidatus Aminicenantes bacterium]|nr:hypothetical protein [Candidatus Aminicenantes bacterium]